jgi:hypothetical protein
MLPLRAVLHPSVKLVREVCVSPPRFASASVARCAISWWLQRYVRLRVSFALPGPSPPKSCKQIATLRTQVPCNHGPLTVGLSRGSCLLENFLLSSLDLTFPPAPPSFGMIWSRERT